MARAILDYTKTILKKVSFYVHFFFKELKKAVKRLLPFEIEELRIWLLQYTADRPELYPSIALIEK